MPVISAYVGSKQITFLVIGSSEGYEIFKFPFVFSSNLQSHFTDEATFYADVFKHVQKKFNLSLKECDLFVCSNLQPIKINLDVKVNTVVSELSSDLQNTNFICTDLVSSIPISKMNETKMNTILSNLSLVPHMLAEKSRNRMYLDSILLSCLQDRIFNLDQKFPVLFCGDKFSSEYGDIAWSYQSVLSFIRTPGVFDVLIDTQGLFLPLLLLKKHLPELYKTLSMEIFPDVLGTVMRLDKSAECLFKTDLGTSQFFDVPENNLFFVPLEEGSKAHVDVKSLGLGQYSGFVHGGKLGFVVDTRVMDMRFLDISADEENLILFGNLKRQIEEVSTHL